MNYQTKILATLIPVVSLLASGSAHAYIGPGAGISAIGSALALIAAILLAIVGFIWYPMKRLLKKRRKAATQDAVNNVAENNVAENTSENAAKNISESTTAENNTSKNNT